MRPELLACMMIGVATLCGCPDETHPGTTGSGGGGGSAGGGVGGQGGYDEGPPASPKSIVRFKTGKRLKQELSRALEIAPGELCKELGTLDCFGIHQVVLGSPDAFFAGIYEALPDTTVTTPLAVDRVVLAACGQRADLDFAQPSSGLIFEALPLEDGKITDLDSQKVTDAIERIYRRALGRDAKESELAHHRQLYLDLEAVGSEQLARDWATLSCFSVFTTMEALFY